MLTRGIHVVWTTYMTWLPGDSRGHWSPMFDIYGRLRAAGHRINLQDPTSAARASEKAVDPPMLLGGLERAVVAHALSEHIRWPTHSPRLAGGVVKRAEGAGNKHAAERRKPVCYAAAIEQNHVHLLFGPIEENIGSFVGRLKGRSSSDLLKLPGHADRQRVWTGGYWKVYLFDDDALRAVARYIEQHNVRRGLDASPYDWVTPVGG